MVNRLQLKKLVLFNPANFRRMLPHSLIQSFVIEVENKRNGILLEFFAFGHILGGVFLNLFANPVCLLLCYALAVNNRYK